MDYLKYYDLERYLFKDVNEKFHSNKHLSAEDFFCIIIWKSNRSKSTIAKRLKESMHSTDLQYICKEITSKIYEKDTPKEKAKYLIEEVKFRLPMASAILTVLYPKVFTIYDIRVCNILGKYHNLKNRSTIKGIWTEYTQYINDVKNSTTMIESLRDKDRILWAKSFWDDLIRDVENGMQRRDP